MTENIKKEIAALRKMNVPELRKRHIDLFGEPNRSGDRQYLFRRIAWRLQAQSETGSAGGKAFELGRRFGATGLVVRDAWRTGTHSQRQRFGVYRHGRSEVVEECGSEDVVHRTRIALGERIH